MISQRLQSFPKDAEGMPLLKIFSSHAREALQEGSRRVRWPCRAVRGFFRVRGSTKMADFSQTKARIDLLCPNSQILVGFIEDDLHEGSISRD